MICNVMVKYIRPEYTNLKEWCEDPQNVYIGRKGVVFVGGERYPKKDSVFCNPYKINAGVTREQVIEKYRLYITNRILLEPDLKEALSQLKGKRLGCWCKEATRDVACHGDVLLSLIKTECVPE